MLKRTSRLLWRGAWILTKAMAAFLGMVFVLLMLLIWRANQGPIVIDSLAPQLAQILSNQETGFRTAIDHAQLVWSREEQALRLLASDVRIFDRAGRRLASLPQLALGLNFLAPLRGQLAPLELHANDLSLRLTRTDSGALQFGDKALEQAADTPTLTHADIVRMVQESLQLRPAWFGLGRVGAVHLLRVTIIIADARSQSDWGTLTIPQLDVLRSLVSLRLSGRVVARLGAAEPAVLNLDALHHQRRGDVEIRAAFTALNPSPWLAAFGLPADSGTLDAPLAGEITARLDEQILLRDLRIGLQGGAGKLAVPALWPQPLSVNGLALRARLEPLNHRVEVTEAVLDIGGVKLAVKAMLAPEEARDGDRLALQAEAVIRDWPLDRVAEIWPAVVASNPRAWITANMSHGVFREVGAALKAVTSWSRLDDLRDIALRGKLSLENATIKYIEGMPPVIGISAIADADQDNMRIKTKGGKADRVVLSDSAIVISGLSGKDQDIDIHIAARNSISEVMRLIDHPPLGYVSKLGLKPEQVGGQADIDLNLAFPLLKDVPLEAMRIGGQARMTGLSSDKLVKGLAITEGDLTLDIDARRLGVQGEAAYNGVRLKTDYRQLFAPPEQPAPEAKAKLQGNLTADDLAKLGAPVTAEMIAGHIPAVLDYEKSFDGTAMLQLAADFTPAAVKLPMLGWEKPEKQPAGGKVKLLLEKDGVQFKQFALQGEKLNIRLDGLLDAGMRPRALTCQPCKIGRNDLTVKLIFYDGALSDIALTGAVLDYHDASSRKDAREDRPPQPFTLTMDIGKFYQGSEHYFADLRGMLRRDVMGWDTIDVRAVAEGRVPVSVSLLPQSRGIRKFTVETDDLGDVLRAAGITDQVHQGKLTITGNSTAQQPYRIMGKVRVTDYRVRKLPVLMVLLNAASITGFADMMAGEGLNFDRLEGGFDWNGQRLGLDDVRTAGGALGLNVEGEMDFGANAINLRGTVVPFSFFNSVIGAIPIVGDVLTGGKGGGVVAATYRARGELDNPDISVNPVSFLAPGILRRIFFQD